MPFLQGQTLVHPAHGPLRVLNITSRTVRGTTEMYLDMESLGHPLRISVPASRADLVGLREVASRERIDSLVAVLSAPTDEQVLSWGRRLKSYQERVGTGEIEQLCFVVREITRRAPKSPASAESQLLRSTRATLAIEFSLALDITIEQAVQLIDTAALGEAIGADSIGTIAAA